jgi:hypothetical protein
MPRLQNRMVKGQFGPVVLDMFQDVEAHDGIPIVPRRVVNRSLDKRLFRQHPPELLAEGRFRLDALQELDVGQGPQSNRHLADARSDLQRPPADEHRNLIGQQALVIGGFPQGPEIEIVGNRVLIEFFGHYGGGEGK